MPLYDYCCEVCGPFEARRPMSESHALVPCAVCRTPAPRMMSAPRLNLMSSTNRYAHTRNEKSAHEPDVVHRLAPHEAHSHSHAHKHAHARPLQKQHKHAHAAKRPWMLGH